MKWRVLISAPHMQPILHEYAGIFAENGIEVIVPPVCERLGEEELLCWIGDVDGVICGDDQFTERVMRAAPRLKVISKWGTGIDSIDLGAARRRGISVYNTPGAFSEPVADTVMGYILSFARQLPWMHQDMCAGVWHKRACVSLRECVLGVIGLGDVGKAVIWRARAFGMRLLGNDILEIPPTFVTETALEVVPKDDLLRQADFVSLNCDLNPTSFHLIGERELAIMKAGACLINTARGPIVDEAALARALQEGSIGGAALDVFEVEPVPDGSLLRKLDNVLLAPHNANNAPTAWRMVHESTVSNLLKGLLDGADGPDALDRETQKGNNGQS